MYISIDDLRRKVDDKYDKPKLIHILWLCLNYVSKHPESKFDIGLFWIDDSHFIINTFIFGLFINRKPNTINRNLRSHGFQYKKTTFEFRKSLNIIFPDPKNWIVRWCEKFNRSTTEQESMAWKYNELPIKNHKINYELNNEQKKTIPTEIQIPFDFYSNNDINDAFSPDIQKDSKDPNDIFDYNFDEFKFPDELEPVMEHNENDYFSLF